MGRPITLTLQALALGWFSFVATLGGVVGLVLSAGAIMPLGPLLGATFLVTGLLGARATFRMWRRRADAARAIIEFTTVGALIPLWLFLAFPPDQRGKAMGPVLVGTAMWVLVGLVVARSARRASPGAA